MSVLPVTYTKDYTYSTDFTYTVIEISVEELIILDCVVTCARFMNCNIYVGGEVLISPKASSTNSWNELEP